MTKIHLPIIWIERIRLLQVCFSHFIAKQDSIFTDICFKQSTQFCSACSSIGLIYYGPANSSFRRQIPCSNYFIIIIYHEVFFYVFFPNHYFQKIVFLKKSYSLISGVLQGLVKICKKYMEVNNF